MSEHKQRERAAGEMLGDAPVEPEYIEKMTAICHVLDETFNGDLKHPHKPTGFVLLVFPFEGIGRGDGRANFMSNGANRKDLVVLFKEMIARFEGMPTSEGRA